MIRVEVHFTNGTCQVNVINNTFYDSSVLLDSYYASKEHIKKITWRKIDFPGKQMFNYSDFIRVKRWSKCYA